MVEFRIADRTCVVGHEVTIRGGLLGRSHRSAKTLTSKKIRFGEAQVECVQVSQYDHWLSHVITGQSRRSYPLRDVEAFDVVLTSPRKLPHRARTRTPARALGREPSRHSLHEPAECARALTPCDLSLCVRVSLSVRACAVRVPPARSHARRALDQPRGG